MRMQVALPSRVDLRPRRLVWVLLGLMGIGLVVAVVRFANGIGAISDLSNTYPWGFWISFDLFTGVAIGSGAFVMAAAVYIFELKEFRPLLRPSVLTGFLGYIMVILALLVDLGRPERIWHLMIYWNHTSILFEIGVCVMSYTAVLAIEFAPVLFEGLKLETWARRIHRYIMPFVILGVVLSTLHQSSLGSLLLIQPEKLHALWWTPLLPVFFFVSAVAIGLAMIILESSLSASAFGRGLETPLLEKLARAAMVVSGIYLLMKFGELAWTGELGLLLSSGSMSLLFWAELILGSVVPLVLFAIPRFRHSPKGLLVGATILLAGMILNRFDVSWFAIRRLTDVGYIPTLPEISISVAIFSFGILAFILAARYLPLLDPQEKTSAPAEIAGAHG
ncbi:MAG TPA: Ni/Fe-hydrogenase cytochrome b subunit [Anaerolineales bacterium]|nr:Ni/Fe-hydrogenase cytochrome b subunit [Anaerolineales bacterium]